MKKRKNKRHTTRGDEHTQGTAADTADTAGTASNTRTWKDMRERHLIREKHTFVYIKATQDCAKGLIK